jgi:hypothetical protein
MPGARGFGPCYSGLVKPSDEKCNDVSSLVEQLQALALDRSVPVEDLLSRAKVVASKLDLPEFLS